jgi:hypothetical protein
MKLNLLAMGKANSFRQEIEQTFKEKSSNMSHLEHIVSLSSAADCTLRKISDKNLGNY